MLADWEIEQEIQDGDLKVYPFDPTNLQPASLDVRLGSEFRGPSGGRKLFFSSGSIAIEPGEFLLACTYEYVEIPPYLACRVEGKSSIGRRGIGIHVTAGFVDPGFRGQLTLEMTNQSRLSFRMEPKMLIAQLSFHRMSAIPRRPYGHPDLGSHYQDQRGPTPARRKR